jgi:Subtilase family
MRPSLQRRRPPGALSRTLLWTLVPMALLGCRDLFGPDRQLPEPAAPEVNVLARLDCTVSRESLTLTCVSPQQEASRGGSAAQGWLGNGEVKLRSYNVSYDSITEIFQGDITVENLLPEVIGTRDGTTVTGVRVFHHDGPRATSYLVPGSTDTVTVDNADGYRTFTKPNQPYFEYGEILATNDTSQAKLWRWRVPRSVNTFAFSVMVDAGLPSEAQVPGTPPDTVPRWIYSSGNVISGYPNIAGRIAKDIVVVLFKPYTTQPKRLAAINAINGTVIGGRRVYNGDGFYYVQVPGDGTSGPAYRAVETLLTLPQVQLATEEFIDLVRPISVRPGEGGSFSAWQVRSDSADGDNWGPEAITAMLAWGCSRGDTTAAVAVVDHDFHAHTDLTSNQHPMLGSPSFGWFTAAGDTIDHGTKVASIIAARGNNLTGITGMMWNAHLRMYDAAVRLNGDTSYSGNSAIQALALPERIIQAGTEGADVINLSWGLDWWAVGGYGYNPAVDSAHIVAANHAAVRRVGARMAGLIRQLQALSPARRPLFVIAAGNNNLPAYWSGFPNVRDTFPNQVIVVASATRTGPNTFVRSSFSNHGPLVEVIAPGEDVYALNRTAAPVPASGTSFAAPHVTGVAGLLMSFDRRLTNADSLRRLILRGARLGGRTVGGYPMLDAYQSLRLAASRRTAPLCGNPVHQDSLGQVFTRRDTLWMVGRDTSSSRLERIFTTADTIPDVKHGGRRVRFLSTNGFTWELAGSPGSWTAAWNTAAAMADTIANATNRSKQGRSHSDFRATYTDTTVTVTKSTLSTTTTTRTERFQLVVNGSSHRTVDVTVPRRQFLPLKYNGCASWYVSDPTISTCLEAVPFGGAAWRDSTQTRATAALSPAGDTIVLAIARDSFAFDVSEPLGNGATFERPYGAYEETLWTDLYFVPVRGSGAIRGPMRVIERVEALGVSENGRHLVAQTRSKFFYRQATANVTFPTNPRYNHCTANFYLSDGTLVSTTPVVSRTPYSSTASCYPGSLYAP